MYRHMIRYDEPPDPRLQLHIADTQEELEACFGLLHDAYVASGFMKPDPSGLRVTIYHALPTTTTLAATWEGRVVGTLSLIREGVFGFPLQSVFDLSTVRASGGRIAEASALAVHPDFRSQGGMVLFALMKFMYDYCTSFFDTRHLVIAVNPAHIAMYESLLLFRRLQQQVVDNYDFVNGAPAVGATLDLVQADADFEAVYGSMPPRRNLHRYFFRSRLPNIRLPKRPYHTTNDPVMTPALLDHFFNRRTRVFDAMTLRQRMLLHGIYGDGDYRAVLPALAPEAGPSQQTRRHPRYSIKCPAVFTVAGQGIELTIIEMSLNGFQAMTTGDLLLHSRGRLLVELGAGLESEVETAVVRRIPSETGQYHGFFVVQPDAAWVRCVQELERSQTHADLARSAA